jgi:hypothetical protein
MKLFIKRRVFGQRAKPPGDDHDHVMGNGNGYGNGKDIRRCFLRAKSRFERRISSLQHKKKDGPS